MNISHVNMNNLTNVLNESIDNGCGSKVQTRDITDFPSSVPPPLPTFRFVQFHSCNSCPNFVEDLQVTWLVVTEVRSASFTASGWLQRAVTKTHVMLRLFFIVACGIARLLCAMRVFEVRASSSPLGGRKRNEICHKGSLGALGYLYDKFRFFRGLRGARMMLELRNMEKNRVSLLTQSLIHSAYLMPREPKLAVRNKRFCITQVGHV